MKHQDFFNRGALFLTVVLGLFCVRPAQAQCIQLNCMNDTIIPNDAGQCEAVYIFSAPTGVDICSFVSDTFYFTGSEQFYVVPVGVDTVNAIAYGAQGGANWASNTNFGGMSEGDIPVTAGDTLYVYVGEQPSGLTGGFNGGGNGELAGAGGGGASDVRYGGKTLNDRILVAGGGGGAGYWNSQHVVGGVGGGTTGGDGYRGTATSPGGQGGTQTSSGTGTCVSLNNPSVSGGFGFGGSPSGCGCESYGGGGGWYGGAGSGNCRGGGGGSGYTDASLSNASMTSGVQTGHGFVVLQYINPNPTVTVTQYDGPASGTSIPVGTFNIKYLATNLSGDTAYCEWSTTVEDVEPPVLTCPGDIITNSTTLAGLGLVNKTDNCTGVSVAYRLEGATTKTGVTDASGSTFNLGITDVWYIGTDPSGNKDSCMFSVIVRPVGIEETTDNVSVKVFPNPNNGLFYMELNGFKKPTVQVQVFDLNGKVVHNDTYRTGGQRQIDLNLLKPGMYLMKVDQISLTDPLIIK